MNKLLIISIILSLLLLVGCDNNDNDNMTQKEKAQDALLEELEECNRAFGANDVESNRERNKEYCNHVLGIINDLIRDGYFDEEYPGEVDEEFAENETQEKYGEVNKIRDSVIGDI